MKITNLTRTMLIADHALMADTFVSRLIGLLDRNSLKKSEALVLTRCQSIHMLFMRFSIDVIFLNKGKKVVGILENIKPFQFSRIYPSAYYAVECPPGTISSSRTAVGDDVYF